MTEPVRLLSDQRVAVERRLGALEGAIAELRRDRAGDPADDEHDPEGVTLSTEWSRLEGLRTGAIEERAEIDAALTRLDEGRYGVCIDCGRAIPAARLEARPTALRCVDCAAKAVR